MRFSSVALTIPAGGTTTEPLPVDDRALLDIAISNGWTTAPLTLQASLNGTAWLDVYDQIGGEITIQAAADRLVRFDAGLPLGARFIRFRSGTSAAPVTQPAARILTVALREFD